MVGKGDESYLSYKTTRGTRKQGLIERSNCYPKDARESCDFYTSDEIAFDVIGFDLQKEAGWDTSILGCTSY